MVIIMKSIAIRSVATLLTAGMLLTGFSGCNKTLEEKKEESLLSAFSKDASIDFEMIIYATNSIENGQKQLHIYGYNKQEGIEDESTIKDRYMQANYNITEDEYDEFEEVCGDVEVVYPFNEETLNYFKKIVKKYDPVEVKTGRLIHSAYQEFDGIVEEYYNTK